MAKQEKVFLTVIQIVAGIITLIDEEGQIVSYRQRGISKYSDRQLRVLIGAGLLDQRWRMFEEIPKNISIYYEDPEVKGKAQIRYPDLDKIANKLNILADLDNDEDNETDSFHS